VLFSFYKDFNEITQESIWHKILRIIIMMFSLAVPNRYRNLWSRDILSFLSNRRFYSARKDILIPWSAIPKPWETHLK
jgi:hypothetical protein